MPPALENKPELYDDLDDVYTAFIRLSASRIYNNHAPCPISITEILTYHREMEVMREKEEFIELIQGADHAYLNEVTNKRGNTGTKS